MIRFSAVLVAIAIGVLVGGVATSKLSLVYIAIAVSAAALLALAIGVVLRREELFGAEPVLAPVGANGSGLPNGAADAQTAEFPAQAAGRSAHGSPWGTGEPAGGDMWGNARTGQDRDRPAFGQGVFGPPGQGLPAPGQPAFGSARSGPSGPDLPWPGEPAHGRTPQPAAAWEPPMAPAAPLAPPPAPAPSAPPGPPAPGPRDPWLSSDSVRGTHQPGGADSRLPADRDGRGAGGWETARDAPGSDQRRPSPPGRHIRNAGADFTPPAFTPAAPPPSPAQSWRDRRGSSAESAGAGAGAGTAGSAADSEPSPPSSWLSPAPSAPGAAGRPGPRDEARPPAARPQDHPVPTFRPAAPAPDTTARTEDSPRTWFDRPVPDTTDPAVPDTAASAVPDTADSVVPETDNSSDDWPDRYSWLDDDEPAADATAAEQVAVAEKIADDEKQDRDSADSAPPAAAGDESPAAESAKSAESAANEPARAADAAESAVPDTARSAGKPGGGEAAAADAESEPGAGTDQGAGNDKRDTEAGKKLVTVLPGVPRYHDSGCILIRFMSDDDVQKLTIPQAREAGCTPCGACQPEE